MDAKELIIKLSTGDKKSVKDAISYIEKWPPRRSKKRDYSLYKELLFWAVENFSTIKTPRNQVAVLKALKFPLTCLGSKNYDTCSDFLLEVLQNPDGRVREQARHVADWFLMDIDPEIPRPKFNKSKQDNKTEQLVDFVVKIDKIAKRHKLEARGMIYLNEMKPCVYKSIQMFLRRILTNEWLLKIINRAGYRESPSFVEIFGQQDFGYWGVAPHLELNEIQFTMEIKKTEKQNKKSTVGYQFKASLLQDSNIYRVIEINPNLSLNNLAEAIIESFDFDFDHCFGFFDQNPNQGPIYDSIEKYELFNDLPDVESTDAGSVKQTKIKDVWAHMKKKMYFLFDYGDNWIFEVGLENINTNSRSTHRHLHDIIKTVGNSPEQYPQT